MPPAGPFLLRALRYHIQQYTPPARSRGEPVCNTILLFLTCQAEQMPTHPGGHDARGHLALVILQQQWDDIFLFVSGFNTECAKSEERALNFSGRFASARVFARRIPSHFPIVGARTVSNARLTHVCMAGLPAQLWILAAAHVSGGYFEDFKEALGVGVVVGAERLHGGVVGVEGVRHGLRRVLGGLEGEVSFI